MKGLRKIVRIILLALILTIILPSFNSNSVSAQGSGTTINSFTLASDLAINKTYNISGSGSSVNGVLYQFWILDYSTNQWQVAQDYSTNSSFNWTPTKVGRYRIELHVKDKYSSQFFEANEYKDVEVHNVLPTKVSGFTVNSVFYVNNPINVSGNGTSSNSVLYQFWIMDYSKGTWVLVQDYSTKNTFSWTPNKAGKYRIEMHIKDSQSIKFFDDNAFKDIEVKIPEPGKINSFTLDSDLLNNKTYNISGSGSSENGVLYQFWILDYSTNKWQVAQDYSANSSFNWTPTKAGRYRIELHVKDKYSSQFFEANEYKDIEVNNVVPAKVSGFNVDNTFYVNKPSQISGSGTSSNSLLYQFWVMDYGKGTWNLAQDYSDKNTFAWIPSKAGKYRIEMHIKDSQSIKYFDDNAFKDIEVKIPAPAKINSFTLGTEFYTNKNYSISGSANSENGALYQFWILDYSTNQWQVAQDYSVNSTFNWIPTKAGRYRIELHVKDKYSSEFFEANSYKDVMVYNPSVARNATIEVPQDLKAGNTYSIAGSGTSGNKTLYQYWIMDYNVGTWNMIQDYSEQSTFVWNPAKAGDYRVELHVKDAYSNNVFDNNAFKDVVVHANGIYGRTIVVDAGHNYGGDDGAYRTFGSITYSERDLNMQMALKLKAELERLGANVILTRDENDRSTDSANSSLQKRADIANNAKADLFISLHHDVNSSSTRTGMSTHYSTYKPGIDTSGINENGNDPYGWYSGVKIDTTPSDAAIKSRDLATKLVTGLSSSLGYYNLNAHDHNLFVTVNTNMPAVLIEEGFLSNQAEAQKCADQTQQILKAQKIAQIIDEYFKTI